MRIICLLLVFFGLGGATACEPVPGTPTPPITTTTTPPDNNGTHVVFGDSLAWQALNYRGTGRQEFLGRTWFVYPGDGVAQRRGELIYSMIAKPAVLTIALGTNDAGHWDGRDGWTLDDQGVWQEILSHRGPDTKVVIVLPHIQLGTVATEQDLASTELARGWLAEQSGVTVIDWRTYAAPGVLGDDGVHVAPGMEGVRYQATVAGDPL